MRGRRRARSPPAFKLVASCGPDGEMRPRRRARSPPAFKQRSAHIPAHEFNKEEGFKPSRVQTSRTPQTSWAHFGRRARSPPEFKLRELHHRDLDDRPKGGLQALPRSNMKLDVEGAEVHVQEGGTVRPRTRKEGLKPSRVQTTRTTLPVSSTATRRRASSPPAFKPTGQGGGLQTLPRSNMRAECSHGVS